MNGRRPPGSVPGVSDPPDAAGPARVSESLERLQARRERRREAAAKRRRRRRRLLIATPLLGLLCWAIVSYAIWMLEPTSMRFGARSVEWVRAEVPFGNSLVDDIEHIYYTANAPKKGGPAPKSLPAVGLSLPTAGLARAEGRRLATADQAGLRAPAAWRRDLEADRAVDRRRPTGAGDDLPSRSRISGAARLRGLVRPHTHRDRVLPGPLRAAERGRPRADDGALQPALAPARHLQRRLHLRRRRKRLERQRPRQRAAQGRQSHAARLPRRSRRDRQVERRPERGTGSRMGAPEPRSDRLERTPEPRA